MKQVLITSPKTCPRGSNSFTVRIDVDLTGTVLHQLSNVDEQPQFKIGNYNIVIPDLNVFSLSSKVLYSTDLKKVGDFIQLPDPLRVIDTLIARLSRNQILGVTGSISLLIDEINRLITSKKQPSVLGARSKNPAIMGFALGADSQLNEREIAISIRQARRLLLATFTDPDSKPWIKYLVSRLDKDKAAIANLVVMALINQNSNRRLRTKTDKDDKEVINQLVLAMDGIPVFGNRFPNASSTSFEAKTLRLYVDSPADALHIDVEELLKRHQGDDDGDRLFALMVPETIEGFEKPSNPLQWEREYKKAHVAFSLDDLDAPKEKSQMKVMDGFSERGKWVGMLTYAFWLLAFACANNYEAMGFNSKEECFPIVLDLFTPLIEGVMNARKGQDAGMIGAESLAEAVCAMFSGGRPIDEVILMLSVNETDEYNEEEFTKAQVEFLSKLLHTIGGANSATCQLNNNITGACQDPVLLAFALRFKKRAIEFLLNQIPEGQDFYSILVNSLLVKDLYPFRGNRKSITEVARGEEVDLTDLFGYGNYDSPY